MRQKIFYIFVKRQVNETCFFSEQCEAMTEQTECRDGRCVCLFEMNPFFKPDGSVECRAPINKPIEPEKYIDPAMIGVLVAMAVMFIIICVVLRLFSK
uniref:EB domain-containing protein n=1 Tax=Anopheles minimus TaxID=112268 RepID=A0A182VPP0_9DIPT